MDSVDGEPMKMLIDQQIDYHAARVIANVHDWQEHLSVIIAQAKIAHTIQQKAAEICSGRMGRGPLDPDGDYWYDKACGECRDAILNMEIPENE